MLRGDSAAEGTRQEALAMLLEARPFAEGSAAHPIRRALGRVHASNLAKAQRLRRSVRAPIADPARSPSARPAVANGAGTRPACLNTEGR